jgi:cytochrome c2
MFALARCIALLSLVGVINVGHAAPLTVLGNPERGRALIRHFGCGSCHVIPGVSGADALVGPPLTQMGRRIYVAGLLRNTPDNLTYWIEHPQRVVPGNAMPDMGVTHRQAQDIAAYLLTLR